MIGRRLVGAVVVLGVMVAVAVAAVGSGLGAGASFAAVLTVLLATVGRSERQDTALVLTGAACLVIGLLAHAAGPMGGVAAVATVVLLSRWSADALGASALAIAYSLGWSWVGPEVSTGVLLGSVVLATASAMGLRRSMGSAEPGRVDPTAVALALGVAVLAVSVLSPHPAGATVLVTATAIVSRAGSESAPRQAVARVAGAMAGALLVAVLAASVSEGVAAVLTGAAALVALMTVDVSPPAYTAAAVVVTVGTVHGTWESTPWGTAIAYASAVMVAGLLAVLVDVVRHRRAAETLASLVRDRVVRLDRDRPVD